MCVQGGKSPGYEGKGDKADLDNHARQLNPNNPLFHAKGGATAGVGKGLAGHAGAGGKAAAGHGKTPVVAASINDLIIVDNDTQLSLYDRATACHRNMLILHKNQLILSNIDVIVRFGK